MERRKRRSAAQFALLVALAVPLALAPAASAKHAKHHHKASGAKWQWSVATLPGTQTQIQSLSCTSATLCFASGPVDLGASDGGTNNVFWSTQPGALAGWQTAPLESAVQPSLSAGPEPIPELSCQAQGAAAGCMVADGFGNFWLTANPTGGAGAWTQYMVPSAALVGLSCSGAVCGAVDVEGHAITFTNGVVNSIEPVFNASEGLSTASESCAGQFCAAVADGTNADIAWTTNNLGGVWQTGTLGGGVGIIDCPSSSLCLAVGDKVYVSTDPAAGPSSYKPVSGVVPGAISCSSSSFCAIVEERDDIEVSNDPSDPRKSAWTRVKAPFGGGSISCPATRVCAITSGGAKVALGRG
jgi:hypothetical protein